jgi:radical SAM protein with 4Fe4S-binding SPASM domain
MFLSKFLYRFNYKYARFLNPKAPIDITLELSSICNQKCRYCYHADNVNFKKGFMAFETAKKILYQANELKVPSIKFNWRGESHLNQDFYYITSYAKDLGFIDRISNSNFNFLTVNDIIFKAFQNQTKIKISFDSFNKRVFENQRQGSNFERILRNIDWFYERYFDPKNNEIVIQMVRTIHNQFEDLEGTAKKRWPGVKVSIRDCVSNRSIGAEYFGNALPKKRVPCYQAFARLIFDTEGNATCCCPDIDQNFYFGNINKDKLIDIWNNLSLKALRADLTNNCFDSYKTCKSCSSLESYENYKYNWNS